MSKENIAKFQEASAQRPELLERLKDAHTPEAVAAVAQAEGFDFTAEELSEELKTPCAGKLADEELDKVTGGFFFDNSTVTIGYGCTRWKAQDDGSLWLAVKGECGSCAYYCDAGLDFIGNCVNGARFG